MNEREIFCEALQYTDPAQRAAFLDQVCSGDSSLRKRLEQLLVASDQSLNLLDGPLWTAGMEESSDSSSLVVEPDSPIGPYILREKIGEGGFGIVYLAEQNQPIHRKVALKLIKPGMDTQDVIDRFEAERQALAMMDHPHVARVIDAGATSRGLPYFVMELVDGLPITQYCDRETLSIPERLSLFRDVCGAVQHAHQKGIIHRDIKPSNVLVTLQNGRPTAKVIDFGVAKALHQRLTERSVYTQLGQMIGTPQYMSPEQAGVSGLDIDTRADIYSLGVLLYELLTGTPPFDRNMLRVAPLDEVRRIIREVEPPRPSSRVGTSLDSEMTVIAKDRQLDVPSLRRTLQGDLDWIVLKALEKDRSRRYESAGALADDIGRHLENRPVLACPPAAWYIAGKFFRRYSLTISITLLLFLAILIGAGLAVWQGTRAILAERRALADRDRAVAAETRNLALLYAADLRRAADAWQQRDATQMREALALHIPREGESDPRGFEWNWLWKQSGTISQELLPSGGPLYVLALRPTDGLLAAGGADGLLHLFDTRENRLLRSLDLGQSELNGLAYSPDGQWLASAGDDGTVAVWDTSTWRARWRVTAHQALAYQVAFSPDGRWIVSCGNEPDARVWAAENGTLLGVLGSDGLSLDNLSVSPEGLVALGSQGGGAWVYTSDRQLVARHPGTDRFTLVAFSPDGLWLAKGFPDHIIRLYGPGDVTRLSKTYTLPDQIRSLAFSPQANYLVAGDSGGAVHAWQIEALEPNQSSPSPPASFHNGATWQAHEGRVYDLLLSEDGKQLISAGSDGRVRTWAFEQSYMTRFVSKDYQGIAFDAEGELIATHVQGIHWLTGPRAGQPEFPVDGEWQVLCRASESGHLFATDAQYHLFRFSPDLDGRDLISAGENGWYVERMTATPAGDNVAAVYVHENTNEHRVLLLDVREKKVIETLPAGTVVALSYSPDGRLLAYAQGDAIHLVLAESGQEIGVLTGHRTTVSGLAFSPDGEQLASVSHDRSLKIWSASTWTEIWSTVAHQYGAIAVTFSPDGSTVATVGEGGILRLWKWQVERLALEVPVFRGMTCELHFSPDGTRLAALFPSEEIWLFDARESQPDY